VPTTPPTISASPTAPQRGDKTTFSPRVDAFVTWLVAAVAQFAAVAKNVYDNAVDAFSSATAAATSASNASISANSALAASAAAMATANTIPWQSGVTIQQDANVVSPADRRTYRRKTAAGSGTVDPSIDPTNYVLLSADNGGTLLLSTTTISSAVATINFLTAFSAAYDGYIVKVDGLVISTSGPLALRVAQGGVAVSASIYGISSTNLNNGLTSSIGTSAFTTTGFSLTLTFENMNETGDVSRPKAIGMRGIVYGPNLSNTSGPGTGTVDIQGVAAISGSLSGFQLFPPSGGNITAGRIRIYGVRN
jgi:hypothetical protein